MHSSTCFHLTLAGIKGWFVGLDVQRKHPKRKEPLQIGLMDNKQRFLLCLSLCGHQLAKTKVVSVNVCLYARVHLHIGHKNKVAPAPTFETPHIMSLSHEIMTDLYLPCRCKYAKGVEGNAKFQPQPWLLIVQWERGFQTWQFDSRHRFSLVGYPTAK